MTGSWWRLGILVWLLRWRLVDSLLWNWICRSSRRWMGGSVVFLCAFRDRSGLCFGQHYGRLLGGLFVVADPPLRLTCLISAQIMRPAEADRLIPELYRHVEGSLRIAY